MQTLDFFKTPIVPQHCLWISGLLLESGSQASAGLPRLYRARYTAGNRLAMGDKVPGAWGAPGTDPLPAIAAVLAMRWAGLDTKPGVTAQLRSGRLVLRAPERLLSGGRGMDVMTKIEASGSHHAYPVH